MYNGCLNPLHILDPPPNQMMEKLKKYPLLSLTITHGSSFQYSDQIQQRMCTGAYV